jgi:hypothetical protein
MATSPDNQRLKWQQNRQQTGNKAATFCCIRLNLAKFDHPRLARHWHSRTTSPRLKLVIKDEVIFQPGQLTVQMGITALPPGRKKCQ